MRAQGILRKCALHRVFVKDSSFKVLRRQNANIMARRVILPFETACHQLGTSAWSRFSPTPINQNKHPSTLSNVPQPIHFAMAPRRKSQTPTPAAALEQLQKSHALKLVTIAETLSPKDLPQSAQKRSSAVSDDSEQNSDTHPAALEADLVHYKVLSLVANLHEKHLTLRPGTFW